MDVCFRYKVASASKACHSSLKVVDISCVNSGKNRCFCGTVSCMKGVVPVVPYVSCRIPLFLMRDKISLWLDILSLSDFRHKFWISDQSWEISPIRSCVRPILDLFCNAFATGVGRGGGGWVSCPLR